MPSPKLRISRVKNMPPPPYVLMAWTGAAEMLRKIKRKESRRNVGGWKER